MKMLTIECGPVLAHDKMMEKKYGQKINSNGKLERRIVWNLCKHLNTKGFMVTAVDDDGQTIFLRSKNPLIRAKSAMEHIFNLDDSLVYFRSQDHSTEHWVRLVLGNGEDIISDFNYFEGDADGFNAAMEAFDVNDYV